MNIFYKRPLSLILCVLLCGFVFSALSNTTWRTVLLIACAAVFLCSLIVRFVLKAKNKSVFCAILAVAFSVGMLFAIIYFDFYFTPQKHMGKEVYAEGIITNETDNDTVYVELEQINGEKVNHTVVLRLDGNDAQFVHKGARVSFTGTLDAVKSTEDFDTESYYYSRGISATVKEYVSISYLGEEKTGFSDKISDFNDTISRYSVLIMGKDAGALFSALFLGNRNYLSSDVSLNFRRIGISHILALSGMHLAILAAGIFAFLTFLGFGKKSKSIITLILTLAYMTLTGFSVSVVRAGIMLMLSLLLFLLAGVKDSFTSLTVAVLIICIAEPHAIFDFSLWLSAFATLGILVMSELLGKKARPKHIAVRFLSWIGIALLSSIFAISATMLLSSLMAGTISLIGIFTTLIFSLLIELFIYLGVLMLAVGLFSPMLSKLLIAPVSDLIYSAAEFFSSLGHIVLSTDSPITKLFIYLFTVLSILFLVLKIKHKRTALCTLALMFCLIYTFAAYDTYSHVYRDDILYSSEEKQDLIIAKTDGKIAVIDSCTYKNYQAFDAVDVLAEERIWSVDAYVIAHYSYGLTDYLTELFGRVKVGTLFLPEPLCKDEVIIYKMILERLSGHSVNIKPYGIDSTIVLGNVTVSETHRVTYGEGTMKNAFYITVLDRAVSYLGSGMLLSDSINVANKLMFNSDTVVFGSHGKSYSPECELSTFFPSVKRFIIAGDKIGISTAAAAKYNENGTVAEAYRGTVSLIR